MNSPCEKCGDTSDDLYGSGRFCSQRCARSYATQSKRAEISKKVSVSLTGKPVWHAGKSLKKDKELVCKKCGDLFLACRKDKKFCDKHPHGRELPMQAAEEKPKTPEEQKKFEERSLKSRSAWTPERRAEHSRIMKEIVRSNPESYTSSNRGRVKQYEIDNIRLHGTWEVDFYLWAKEKMLSPVRCNEGFQYTWKGNRTYFPDFFLPTLNLYVEVKGYETAQDRAKWSSFPAKLLIIRKEDIEKIRKKAYRFPDTLFQ